MIIKSAKFRHTIIIFQKSVKRSVSSQKSFRKNYIIIITQDKNNRKNPIFSQKFPRRQGNTEKLYSLV